MNWIVDSKRPSKPKEIIKKAEIMKGSNHSGLKTDKRDYTVSSLN